MARGLAGSWGFNTEDDPGRKVGRESMSQAIAARIHNDVRAVDVLQMPDDQWKSLSKGIASKNDVAALLRVYENYEPPETAVGISNPNELSPYKPLTFTNPTSI